MLSTLFISGSFYTKHVHYSRDVKTQIDYSDSQYLAGTRSYKMQVATNAVKNRGADTQGCRSTLPTLLHSLVSTMWHRYSLRVSTAVITAAANLPPMEVLWCVDARGVSLWRDTWSGNWDFWDGYQHRAGTLQQSHMMAYIFDTSVCNIIPSKSYHSDRD